ncbi:MAG: lysophospholipid acyltransferase family protein [Syntrophales bacterium]|nr:lysophospholipid acyltransferase family protein [Syntrophales bacterium]
MINRLSALAIRLGLIPTIAALVTGYASLLRHRTVNEAVFRGNVEKGGKNIAALWHQRILIVMPVAMTYSSYAPSVMISKSRDGDMIADVYSRLKFRPVRGSSSRGGREGLQALVEDLADHPIAVHILDGPRGPRGVVKPGLIRLAQLSGVPIFPVYISVSRAWILNSWDRFIVPKPFSTIVTRFDEPITVPRELTPEEFEDYRRRIERHMLENQRRDDAAFGWHDLI